MRILNFGSLNIDYVYAVDAFLRPGETKAAKSLMVNCGGKGLNQSIAAGQKPAMPFGTLGFWAVRRRCCAISLRKTAWTCALSSRAGAGRACDHSGG